MLVLVPLDGSKLSESVLGPLQACLQKDDGPPELVLLRIVETQGTFVEQESKVDIAEGYLVSLMARLEQSGAKVKIREETADDPASVILDAVKELKPDLVAMSTHGRTGIGRWLRGSVAERVLRSIESTPLLLVNPSSLEEFDPGSCFKKILVPLDGSETSDKILPLVEQMGKTFGSSVTLLRVQPFAPAAVPSPVLAPTVWEPREVEKTIEPQANRLREAGLEVTVKAEIGAESTEIVRLAVDHDLVAMTTHGRSGPSRWWFGSVAEQVIRHCDCPLLVLRAS